MALDSARIRAACFKDRCGRCVLEWSSYSRSIAIRWRWFQIKVPVQHLAPTAADPAFHDRVHPRRLNSGADHSGAGGLEDGADRGGGAPGRAG